MIQKIVAISSLVMIGIFSLCNVASNSNIVFASEQVEVSSEEFSKERTTKDPFSIPLKSIFQIPAGANSYVRNGKYVVITDRVTNQIGSIFSTEQNKLDLTKDFFSEMYIKIDGTADGIAFVMHDDPARTKVYTGIPGGALGVYANNNKNGLQNQMHASFVIEFDTYYNGDSYDSLLQKNSNGHVAYIFPERSGDYTFDQYKNISSLKHHGIQVPSSPLGNNQWRKFTVDWKTLNVSGAGELTYQLEGLAPVTVALSKSIFNNKDSVYWGFSGSTGAEVESALVSFASVPGLVLFSDELNLYDDGGKKVVFTRNDSEVIVQYKGKYTGGKQNLLEPTISFDLFPGQSYQEGSFTVNGQQVIPTYSNNSLSLKLEDLSLQNPKVDIRFKVNNNGLKSLDKPKITSRISAENYIQDLGQTVAYTIDNDGPKGIGKLRVIDKGDVNSITTIEDYKTLLKSYSDNLTTAELLSAKLAENQDLDKLVQSPGPSSFKIVLTDEAKNSSIITIPVYIKNRNDQVVHDDEFLLKGKNLSIKNTEYPKTDRELKDKIVGGSYLELWQADENGALKKIDEKLSTLDISKLPKTGTIPALGAYPLIVTYFSGQSNISLPINLTIEQGNIEVMIEFVDESGDKLHESVTLTKPINSLLEVSKEKEVQEVIQTLISQHYILTYDPGRITVVPGLAPVQYRFKGSLFIQSFPSSINFGEKHLTRPIIKAEQPIYDKPLIIEDTRKNKTSWTLSATLEQILTSEESPSDTLLRALRYKDSENHVTILTKGEAQPVETGLGKQNISEQWEETNTGFELNVFSNQIIQKGKYHATVLWQIGETP